MLSKNWITEKTLDHEYKRYILHGYLQRVSNKFERSLLYPHLAELSEHYALLRNLEDVKKGIQTQFPGEMVGIDPNNREVHYTPLHNDSKEMAAVQDIIDYAEPRMHQCLSEGEELSEFYKTQLEIRSIGVAPLYNDEGYMLLLNIEENCTVAYRYTCTLYDHPQSTYKKINTSCIGSFKASISNTEVAIKRKLVKDIRDLPNPATYSIKTELPIPMEETLLPLATQVLSKFLEDGPKTIH